ncbi:unnamed protein product [Rotaria sp. Silwood2]|nr:unnamed protein product [Rotaria sp. Silwood2]
MNFFNENKNNSTIFSTNNSLSNYRRCTPCYPYDAKNLFYPKFNNFSTIESDFKENNLIKNPDTCCLNKLQVDCRIQCYKKKKKHNKLLHNKRHNSIHSSQSLKRSISLSSQLSQNQKQKKFDSTTNINSHYIHNYDIDSQTSSSILSTLSNTNESDITEQTFSSMEAEKEYKNKSANAQQHYKRSQSRLHINQNIQDLKSSIDNLIELIVQQKNPCQISSLPNQSISFLDKIRRFFTFFKSSSKSTKDLINEECCQILEYHHLTKQNLLSIYHLFDKNETIFLNWLRKIMPDYILPLLLNYVKYFDSISTDNE